MLENKKEIIDNNYLMNKRHDARKKSKFTSAKNRYFLLAIFICLIILIVYYFNTDKTNVYKINIFGNYYLKDDYIRELSKIDTDDKFLFVSKYQTTKRLKSDPIIENAKITKEDNNIININVEEVKIIAYLYENNETLLLLENNNRVALNNENLYLINKIPLISGFNQEQLELIVKGFLDLDALMINEISEIHRYPFSYDENMMKILMRDGNYVFVSSYGLKLINKYYAISSGLNLASKNACIYLDEITNSGYISACPWEETNDDIDIEEDDNH